MSAGGPPEDSILEVAWAGRALSLDGEDSRSETESGDLHVVVPFADGMLVAVIDGLGHGPDAAAASRAAAEVLAAHPGEQVLTLVELCHEEMRRTRGAVMSLASFSAAESSLTWTGVGNVEGTLHRRHVTTEMRREPLTTRGGVVGDRLPPLRAASVPVARGDTLILCTDGIRSRFNEDLALERSPQEIADAILAGHRRDTDDALVLVARYLGRDLVGDVLAAPAVRVPIHEEADVAIARHRARQIARDGGLGDVATEALATSVSEIAQNIVRYAGRGEIAFACVVESGRRGVVVVARDEGPGIPDPEQAMADGYTTGGGLGVGLSGARRLVDEFQLRSTPGRGTIISFKKWAP